MTCDEQQKHLALLASDDLDEVAALSLRKHLLVCSPCRQRLEQFRDGVDWVRRQRLSADSLEVSHDLQRELQKRLARQVSKQSPLFKPWAFVRRIVDQMAPRHEHLVAGCAALLLLVGATGTVRRPLSRWQPWFERSTGVDVDIASASGRNEIHHLPHRHLPHGGLEDSDALVQAGEFGDGLELGEMPDELGIPTQPKDGMRMEMATRDPNVRIIWFAQADTK